MFTLHSTCDPEQPVITLHINLMFIKNLLIQWKALLFQQHYRIQLIRDLQQNLWETDLQLQSPTSKFSWQIFPLGMLQRQRHPDKKYTLNLLVSVPANCEVDKIHLAEKNEVTRLRSERTLSRHVVVLYKSFLWTQSFVYKKR